MKIVNGKEVLKDFREEVQRRWQISLTDIKIIDAFKQEEVSPDMKLLLQKIEAFRVSEVKE